MNAVKVGKNYLTVNPGSNVVQVVAPAANTSGVIVSTCLISTSNGGVGVFTGTSAPSSIVDQSKPIIFSANASSAVGTGSELALPYPLFLPAGQGLWLAASVPGAAVALTWDVLG
ncbi:hypothetical protein Q7O56_25205 [Pseudomonas protegens]|uniref:hypothetical protein n=1 Tax=Pseudomonas chlororaphis group TaxID=136842 RepID=UPI002097F54B|nr:MULTISPECIES: hypothetical protein [Pseudomonas chlororaphis group]MCO7579186.1 hypothetical protein [Pseudomonas protegens]MCO7585082.1 hypothetical protein [Pseudomonas chlororaphis]MCO7602273.1 hypothetical protein [Pseudomonas chlororaphis]MDP9506871.1 hypothetical protein [Pseudomonas protegens]MDP9512331.1 hypothetical protein [Pseudomonas protegens]